MTTLTWAQQFPKAARTLSESERKTLDTGLPAIRNQTVVVSSDRESMMELFSIDPSFAGPVVTPDSAMRVSTVYRCVALIGGAIAGLPVNVYERAEPVRLSVPDHPVRDLFNVRPTSGYSAAVFWEFIAACVLLHGDGFAYLVRNRAGVPVEAIPLLPQNVVVRRMVEGKGIARRQWLEYYVSDGAETFGVHQDDMLHFPGVGFNGCRSMSVISWAAKQAVGIALATDEYSGRFFSGGATPKFVLQAEGKLTDAQQDRLRELWERRYAGASNSHKPLILTEGLSAKELSLSAEDSQLLESRKFQVEDICRAFGVPPFMVGATEKTTTWGSGIEHMGTGFVTYCLQPHLTRFEQEINYKCFGIKRYFAEFNVKGLMRGDIKTQSDAYRQAIGGSQGPGWMTVNEVRRLENQPPVDGGDKLYDPTTVNAPGDSNAKP